MPRIGQLFGIVIAMYFNDRAPPHVHATDGEHEAVLKAGRTIEGWLSEELLPGRHRPSATPDAWPPPARLGSSRSPSIASTHALRISDG